MGGEGGGGEGRESRGREECNEEWERGVKRAKEGVHYTALCEGMWAVEVMQAVEVMRAIAM